MPDFNRRGFLQFLGAAGAAPLLPALPTRAAATTAASTSKALWAGIYAKSGSVPKFAQVARTIGLPSAAIQGVGARSVGIRIGLAAATNPIVRLTGAGNTAAPRTDAFKAAGKMLRDLDDVLPTQAEEPETAETPEFGSASTTDI